MFPRTGGYHANKTLRPPSVGSALRLTKWNVIIKPEISLPCSQKPAILPYPKPYEYYYLRPSGLFTSDFPTKTLYSFLSVITPTTFPDPNFSWRRVQIMKMSPFSQSRLRRCRATSPRDMREWTRPWRCQSRRWVAHIKVRVRNEIGQPR